jgi:flagellar operon protein
MSEPFQIPRGIPIQPIQPKRTPTQQRPVERDSDFAKVLESELQKSTLRFSAHAAKRLQRRNITLTKKQIQSLEEAVNKVSAKGGKESLILLGDVAFVVSVTNRTVITAIDGDTLKDNVFTQIDSAVIT